MDKDLFSHLMKEMQSLGFRYAGITGSGEISLHPQLEDIFLSLAENNINILMISTSEIKLSVIIRKKSANKALRALHKVFGLDKLG